MAVRIEVTSSKTAYAYGEPLRLGYRITNTGPAAVYIVRSEPKTAVGTGALDLLVGEPATAARVRYFAFMAPPLRQIAAGSSVRGNLRIGMPPQTVTVDQMGRSSIEEISISGDVKVTLSVGHLPRLFQPKTPDPLGEFLKAQRIARSKPITVRIAAP